MDEAGEIIIGRHLVGDPLIGCGAVPGSAVPQRGEVASADSEQRIAVERRHEIRKSNRRTVGPAHVEHGIVEGMQLAGAMHRRMAGDDLLHQGGAGTRHADHEDRHCGGVTAARFGRDQCRCEHGFDAVEQRKGGRFVVKGGGALAGVAGEQMGKRA